VIIDVSANISRWPFRRTPCDELPALLAAMKRHGVGQAWVANLDGLFHKDIASVNQRLSDTCTRVADGTLIPFGTINPTLPDWEEDIRRCHETLHMPGIRLHPNYHGYSLDAPRFARLLELAAARGLIVQLVVWMEAERHLLLNPHTAQVDLKPLAEKLAAFPQLKLVVANGSPTTDDEGIHALLPLKTIHFDFARAENAKDIRMLIDKVSADRVVFGSAMPLHDIEPAIVSLQRAQLSEADSKAIAMKNANRLVTVKPIR
jgi:predicted TIM-barrel fold metal-dependent hydrolase